jgi:tetratricopeptide (TPR) repeat protein
MATNWQKGNRIQNRWEIREIKQGGMGVVYIVYDYQLQDFHAAKTFQDRFLNNKAEQSSFNLEARAWINLDIHQNITQARFVHTIENKPFLFMEFVSGGDLGGWIGTPRLTKDLSQVLRFAIQFCDGMHYALSKGIEAHRDIKPQNCLITKDKVLKVTDFGLVKVPDFGLVRVPVFGGVGLVEKSHNVKIGSQESDKTNKDQQVHGGWFGRLFKGRQAINESRNKTSSTQHLKTGLEDIQRVGGRSPHYMAPEVFDDVTLVGVHSDIYAFGVMLFQMITGRLPFIAQTSTQAERLHKTEPPPKLDPSPSALNDVVQTCLAKDPAHRFADFAAARKALAEIYEQLTGESAPQPAKGAELNAEQWVNKGHNLSQLGPHEEALTCFDRALNLNPRYAEAWSSKGGILSFLGRYEEALTCLDRALELDLRDETAWSNKGVALGKLGGYEEALTCLDHALELNPHNEHIWSNKGRVLDEIGRREEALTCFEQALERDPRNEAAWSNKGGTLWELGQHQEGLACLERALEINPSHSDAWANKGRAMGALGQHAEALACFEKALEFNHRNAKVWSDKGVALAALGRSQEELACYQRALKINPRDKMTWYNRGVALRGLGRREEAITCFDHAIDLDPRFVNAWHNKGLELRNLGRHEEALACFDRALELDPNDIETWYDKGVELGEPLGRYEEALACYDRVLALNPRHMSAWNNKGAVLGSLRRYGEALKCFEKAQQLGHPQATQRIADCRRILEGYPQGMPSASDREAEEWFNKSMTLVNAQRWEEAFTCLNHAIALSPRNVNVWVNKGLVLERLGRSEEGIACFDHALTINSRDKMAWYNKGSVLGNLGLLREAMVCFEEAQRLGHPQAAQMIVLCRQMLGQR